MIAPAVAPRLGPARALTLLVVVTAAAACGGAPIGAGAAPRAGTGPDAVRYVVRPEPGLATIAVEVCFRGAAPRALVARTRDDARFVRSARVRGAGSLPVQDERIEVARLSRDACIDYVVDLGAAASAARFGARSAGAGVVPASTWLWAPWPRSPDLDVRVSIDSPDDVGVSLPWPARRPGDERNLDARAFRFQSYTAFGRFDTDTIDVPGATIELAVLDPERAPPHAAIRDWLSEAARAASLLYGTFPSPWAQVIVVPTRASDSPVAFGITGRGSPGSMVLFVAPNAERQALVSDWVAVHEMTHLGAPFVSRDESWLTEGLATYYQEVLRGRAGLQSPEQTFWALDDGFRRGAESGGQRTLREESGGFAFERIYWGGAAIAFEADVELRRRSGGARSLDDALDLLRVCCSEDARPWSAAEMVARIDEAAGNHVFGDAVRRHLGSTDFPPARALLARLGVTTDARSAHLDDGAPDAAIRRALLEPRTGAAQLSVPSSSSPSASAGWGVPPRCCRRGSPSACRASPASSRS